MTSFVAEFDARFSDVQRTMGDLARLEREIKTQGRLGKRLEAAAIIRASTIIIAYNAIEGSFNNAVRTMRLKLTSGELRFFDATTYWQKEVLRHRLLGRLRDGIAHDKLLDEVHKLLSDASSSAVWLFDDKRMPSSGNIDQKHFYDFCTELGTRIVVPRSAGGGTDLEQIRRDRNDLAHGIRSFSEVGGLYTLGDLGPRYRRVQIFMRAALRSLQRYYDAARFRMAPV